MTYLRRQVAMRTAKGIIEFLPQGTVFPYRLTDVEPKFVLKLASGMYTSNVIQLNASDSYSIPLPSSYSNADQLACFFRADGVTKVVVVDPVLGTSTFLLKGTTGTTKGDHKGILMFQARVTSITVSLAVGADDTNIDYFLWGMPDLTLADSWQQGNYSLGVIP